MKTKLLLSTLLSFSFYLLSSQVPQGFNYQAIARGSDGKEIPNATLQVKVSILSDTTGFYGSGSGTYVWEELHSVKTNSLGLFTLTVGNLLATKVQGSALSFSSIDWKQTPLYIGTKINYNGWKNMGTSPLWTVPYSMVAGELEGAVDKLEVIGSDPLSDEALFEVKRKDGQTMFAVYNHGVRVYMPLDTLSKARKGGFAIGGFSKAKGTVQDYFVVNPDSIRAYIDTNPDKARKGGFAIGGFDKAKAGNEEYLRVTRDSTRIYLNDTGVKARKGGFAIGGFDRAKGNIQDFMTVSPDSIRMYIDDTPVKALKGGFAIGGFDKAKGGNSSFFNVFPDSTGKVYPSQNRILWYPLKNALLAGRVIAENKDSVGENSFSSGFESRSKGKYSQALGYKAIARGDYSTAIGKNAVANKINSFAFGEAAIASNDESYAFGREAKALGYRSFAFGSAGLDNTGEITLPPYATGDYSFALGEGSFASGKGSLSVGRSTAFGDYSLAIGNHAISTGICSSSIGWGAKANGEFSTAIGDESLASGWAAMALAGGNSNGYNSIAIGGSSTTSADYSIAIGHSAKASAMYSYSFGGARADGMFSVAIGDGAYATAKFSNSFGTSCGSTGQYAQAFGLSTHATGERSLAMGENTTSGGTNSVALGYYTIAPSGFEMVVGRYNTTYTPVSTTDWNNSDRLFVIGNGTYSSRSDAMVILKNGNVGIGNATPSEKLEIAGTSSKVFLNSVSSNMILFNNNGTAAPSFNTRSIGTKIVLFQQLNTTNADFAFGIDASTLWYSIPQAVSSAAHKFYAGTTELLRIRGDGNVGIGTASPGYKLTVNGTAWCSSGTWTGSDIRWKKNILPIDKTLQAIMDMQAVVYDLRTDEFPQMGFESGSQIGLIAQDVEKVFPLLVNTDNNGFKAVAYDKLSVVLIEAVKEQQKQIESQNERIERLEKIIEEMQGVIMANQSK
jgi:hypothetical protein